jgi:hypothetical protein
MYDEPSWLVIVVVGVSWRERTDDEPKWLVVVVVGVAGENGQTTSLGGSSLSLWVWVGSSQWVWAGERVGADDPRQRCHWAGENRRTTSLGGSSSL